MKINNTKYEEIYKKYSPLSKTPLNVLWAFLVGGLICTIGEGIKMGYMALGLGETEVAIALPATMIFIGVALTALRVYKHIAKVGGAGTIVPITGFANAIASAAVEFKSEGIIFGTCVRMFTIAGPVLVFGVSASIIYGLILCILR